MAQDNTGSEVIASPVGHSVCTPFDLQMVSISKAEHIQLKWNANYWRTQFYNLLEIDPPADLLNAEIDIERYSGYLL